jgi:ribosomal protein S18 acetylase RimI-like enzyme
MEDWTISTLGKEDLTSVALIHRKAFADRALVGLGQEAVRRYYEWQLDGPHDAIALGITQQGKLSGFCFAGVFRGALTGFLRKNMWFLVGRVLIRPWLMASPLFRERLSLAWNVLRRRSFPSALQAAAAPRSFGILAIAVDPEIQGAGLGKGLMAAAEKKARERNFSCMHLTVDVDNAQAIGFYENLGWQRFPGPDGIWHGYMTKYLGRQ